MKFFRKNPEWLFFLALGFLIISWAMIYLIDVINLFGIRDRFYTPETGAFFFRHWFVTPVEVPVQWLFLFGAMYVFFLNAGRTAGDKNQRPFKFWRLMGLGSIFMVMEDVYNIRHQLRGYIGRWAGDGAYGYLATFFELGYFAAIGTVLIYAFFRYRRVFWNRPKTRRYLISGYGFYGTAVCASWLGTAFHDHLEENLYTGAGRVFTNILFGSHPEASELYSRANEHLAGTGTELLEYWFMDSVVEESIELLGAAALLVAGLAFYRSYDAEKGG